MDTQDITLGGNVKGSVTDRKAPPADGVEDNEDSEKPEEPSEPIQENVNSEDKNKKEIR